jgi:hypothetical protein
MKNMTAKILGIFSTEKLNTKLVWKFIAIDLVLIVVTYFVIRSQQ